MSEHPPCADPMCATCAQDRCTAGFRGEQSEEADVQVCPQCGHELTPMPAPTRVTESVRLGEVEVSAKDAHNSVTEAMINGSRSFDDIRELVRRAVRAMLAAQGGYDGYCWAYIYDISDTDVVYMVNDDELFQCSYALTGEVATLGEPVRVVRTYMPAPAEPEPASADVMETAQTARRVEIGGTARVLEAKGTAADGGRIFAVQIIAYGDSKNGNRYPEAVLRKAAPLYEGSKAFDHHRTEEEMRSGTIRGLVGYYRSVTGGTQGLEADLYLLPSATHAAEALDAALALENADPLVGISHDAYALFKPIQENGKRLQEATEITSVNSADIVAHPAAGGQATRVVAGGVDTEPTGKEPAVESTKETDVAVNAADVLAALKEITPEQLAEAGLQRVGAPTTETENKPAEPAAVTETEELLPKVSFLGRTMIKGKVTEAGLPKDFIEAITNALPEQVNEAIVDAQIAAQKSVLAVAERAGLAPAAGGVKVTQESLEKKIAALDAFFVKDHVKGYRSFKEAFCDITGRQPRAFDEDFNRTILRECFGASYGSSRTRESITTSTFDVILGDAVTRRMAMEYAHPDLQSWRLVTSTVSVNDFRTQRIERMGGYGTLPIVNQGAPYQSLTSPTDEEATYAINKKGGTEDLTFETVANDDIRAIQRIPVKLGQAAAQTLYRFAWDMLPANAATSYDSVALFHASHGNTTAAVLSQTALSAARVKMRQQAAYGDSKDVLSMVPKYLIVPSNLEELAFQLCTSAVAIPATPAGPTDTPNIHQGMQPIVIDYYTDVDDWYLSTDPARCPGIEIGFYQGRQEPELFTQADQTVGSMFDADKMTWKIRHIYWGTVVDHRGFQRGTN